MHRHTQNVDMIVTTVKMHHMKTDNVDNNTCFGKIVKCYIHYIQTAYTVHVYMKTEIW